MAEWTYSGNPRTSPKDALRFNIGDTNENYPLFSDDELEYLMEEYTDETTLLFNIYSKLADKFSRDIKKKLGPASEDPTERARYYASKAAELEEELKRRRGLPEAIVTKDRWFRVGVHNNV